MITRLVTFPREQAEARKKLKKLSWWSIGLLTFAGSLLAYTLGQSQAMKTAWVSDVLTAVPPIGLLIAMRFEQRPPTARFPYGYARAVAIAFLGTASMLLIIGLYLLVDSAMKLILQEKPPIGTMDLFGQRFWAGWAMIGTLSISLAIGMTLGRMKKPIAEKLHSKAAEAESEMNRAEWMSEGAAIVGILLVGFGFWWGDAVAAGFISLEIVRGGWQNLRQVIGDLMDESPTELGERKLEKMPAQLERALAKLPWVQRASVRLREHGHMVTGDVLIVPADGTGDGDLLRNVQRTAEFVQEQDWRLHHMTVMPVASLDVIDPPPAPADM
jgi:cation diffusion facilitator family transporter